MLIQLPDPSLVLLIGPSGSGKSTFAQRHFRPTQVLSSDFCRALVCDDEGNQAATNDAFELLHLILAKRLKRGRTTVIDATNVQALWRERFKAAAIENNIPLAAIVFALPEEVCQLRNRQRTQRQVPGTVIREQIGELGQFQPEGFHSVFRFENTEQVEETSILLVAQGSPGIDSRST